MKLLILALTISFSSSVFASALSFDYEFNYKENGVKVDAVKKLSYDSKDKTWKTITNDKSGVILLAKVVEENAKTVSMEYLILDSKNQNAVLATPKIVAKLGEKARIAMMDKSNEGFTINILVK